MKTPFKQLVVTIFTFATILYCSATDLNQSSYTNVIASATILRSVQIKKVRNLDFGAIDTSHLPGSISLRTDGHIITKGKTSFIAESQSKPTLAELTIISEENTIFAVSIPLNKIITYNEKGSSITISNIVCEAAKKEPGKETFRIGATLDIGAGQPCGHYINECDFQVMIGYN